MEYPKGFERPGFVLQLQKSIYGLKSASSDWGHLLHSQLILQGFRRSSFGCKRCRSRLHPGCSGLNWVSRIQTGRSGFKSVGSDPIRAGRRRIIYPGLVCPGLRAATLGPIRGSPPGPRCGRPCRRAAACLRACGLVGVWQRPVY
jgi:hypothetical protein